MATPCRRWAAALAPSLGPEPDAADDGASTTLSLAASRVGEFQILCPDPTRVSGNPLARPGSLGQRGRFFGALSEAGTTLVVAVRVAVAARFLGAGLSTARAATIGRRTRRVSSAMTRL